MTLAAVIVFVETLAVFQSPPIALAPDRMGGVYVACPTEIFHYARDTLSESVSRADNEMLSGIGDIDYSGSWLYATIPERGKVRRFDRRLSYLGETETKLNSEKIALTPSGDFWLYDEFSHRMARYSSVGDPVEIVRAAGSAAYMDDAILIGNAKWTELKGCLPTLHGSVTRHIAAIDVPILYVPKDKVVFPGLEYDARIELSPAVGKIWLSNNVIAYSMPGNSIHICGWGEFLWNITKNLPSDIAIYESGVFAIVGKALIKVGIEWGK